MKFRIEKEKLMPENRFAKGLVKLIKQVKIAHSFLKSVSDQLYVVI